MASSNEFLPCYPKTSHRARTRRQLKSTWRPSIIPAALHLICGLAMSPADCIKRSHGSRKVYVLVLAGSQPGAIGRKNVSPTTAFWICSALREAPSPWESIFRRFSSPICGVERHKILAISLRFN